MTSARTLFMASTLIFWNAVGYYAVRCPTKPVCETAPATLPGSRTVTAIELATHATADDCWVAIDGKVYSIAPFQDAHPGDTDLMKKYCGKQASGPYAAKESGKDKGKRHSPRADEFLEDYLVGKFVDK
jgi:cytochrome b involved in lipid metabolism